jgi:isopentenyldiphosphate isomerase
MTGYANTPDGIKSWVPRRSRLKPTYAGMLDNTDGGSLPVGEQPIDCIVREAEEEASIPPEYTRKHVLPCGTLSYIMSRGRPCCQHQTQYVYEMNLEPDLIPKVNDGEVEEFYLMTLDEVRAALARGEFKLNSAMTWLAYFIRQGVVNAENEPDLVEICARLHRKLDLFIVE